MMQKPHCEIRDKKLITGILSMCNVINVGMFNQKYPYVVPFNYGYEYKENLVFYTHHATKGQKIDLIAQNPHVCVEAHVYFDFMTSFQDHSHHDYRSVIAFGTMIPLEPNTEEYSYALKKLMECNGRTMPDQFYKANFSKTMKMYKIVCLPENVTGKSQEPIKELSELAFPVTADNACRINHTILAINKECLP